MSKYNLNKAETIQHAIEIAEEYLALDLKLTLRQLYYQFVARGLEGNGQKVYKRLGAILTEARYSGEFPIRYLEDRGRSVGHGDWTTVDVDVDTALGHCKTYVDSFPEWTVNVSRWWKQDALVSVWVEKEALSGVFEDTCNMLGVPLFAFKGYPSVSALYDWFQKVKRAVDKHSDEGVRDWAPAKIVVLYFGDFDPDGWEIPRSAERNLAKLQALEDTELKIKFVRCALNMDQINKYNPPPFPAKVSSARYEGYIEEHNTDSAWELDALEPSVLRSLIKENVAKFFKATTHLENQALVKERREELRERLHEVL